MVLSAIFILEVQDMPVGKMKSWTFNRRFLRLFLNLFGKQILIAKHLEWEVLKTSDLDWTLVRPPRITNEEASGNISADEKRLESLKVSVGDLTDFILEQMTSKELDQESTFSLFNRIYRKKVTVKQFQTA